MSAVVGFIVLIALITVVKLGVRRLFRGKQPAVAARRPPSGAQGRPRP
jgi:hypothetical protein